MQRSERSYLPHRAYKIWVGTTTTWPYPVRVFRACTTRRGNGWYDAHVAVWHCDARGTAYRVVVCRTNGYWRSRSTAYRRAQDALAVVLSDYPSHAIEPVTVGVNNWR